MKKYCVYCGYEIDQDTKMCPLCREDVSEESENKKYQASVKCPKCNSSNVTFQINRKKVGKIVHEEEVYECKECGKVFKDGNRLGRSFSNSPHIVFSDKSKKTLFWGIVIFLVIGILINNSMKKAAEEENVTKLDCKGLPTMSFKKIKDEANKSGDIDKIRDKYVGKSYIFTAKIQEINGDEIVTPIEEGDYSGSYIYVNKEDLSKLSNYKVGDKIKICGTIKKISLYHKIYVKNSTIIDK